MPPGIWLGPRIICRDDATASYQPVGDDLLTAEELDDLLAPIALYPDPLIAQILPASTFIDQIDEAARYVRQYGKSACVDDQYWDVSVKAVAHYPDVLFMMDQKYDWTVSLGQAYIDQPQDVMDAIQRLRAEAKAQGNLVSTREQQVIVDAEAIRIVPALPDYIYVPVYDPQVVYVERPSPYFGFVTFGVGLSIGAWLTRDCDWHGHRIYYHGWRDGGWVRRSRPHINYRNRVYINRNAGSINVNRRVLQYNTTRYRETIRHDVQRRRELVGRPAPPPRAAQSRPERVGQPRPVAPAQVRPVAPAQVRPVAPAQVRPVAPAQTRPVAPAQPLPEMNPVFRGRDVQRTNPASHSGYGGYGSSKDATRYQERGKSSRENMQKSNSPAAAPAPRPAAAPTPRPAAAPAPRPAAAPAPRPAAVPAPRPAAAPLQGRQQHLLRDRHQHLLATSTGSSTCSEPASSTCSETCSAAGSAPTRFRPYAIGYPARR